MSTLKKIFANYLLLSAICVVLGAALVAKPDFFTRAISYTIGGLAIATGIEEIVRYIVKGEDRRDFVSCLFRGIVLCALGLFLVLNPDFIFKVIAISLGIYMLISGTLGLMNTKDISKNADGWKVPLIFSAVTAIAGIVILFNPMLPTDIMFMVLGIMLIVSGVSNLVGSFSAGRKLKMIKRAYEDTIDDDGKEYIDIE